MMLHHFVQQNQWIVAALLAGTVLTILFWLVYVAMWRPRAEERRRDEEIGITGPWSFFMWVLSFMPWPLILLIAGTTVYTIIHVAAAAMTPPNW